MRRATHIFRKPSAADDLKMANKYVSPFVCDRSYLNIKTGKNNSQSFENKYKSQRTRQAPPQHIQLCYE